MKEYKIDKNDYAISDEELLIFYNEMMAQAMENRDEELVEYYLSLSLNILDSGGKNGTSK